MTLLLCVAFVLQAATLPPQARPSTPAATPPEPSGQNPPVALVNPDDLPVSVDRIRRRVSQAPSIRSDVTRPVFRVEVLGRQPSILDVIGTDFLKGPVPHGSTYHQEFLDAVTPDDVRGYAAFSNKEGLTVAATSFASALAQQAVVRAIRMFKAAVKERERAAARQEVLDALAQLEAARAKAGLPPK